MLIKDNMADMQILRLTLHYRHVLLGYEIM